MTNYANGKYVEIHTYATQLLMDEGSFEGDYGDYDEQPIMAIAVEANWLAKTLYKSGDLPNEDLDDLENFLDNVACYDDLEDVAIEAINKNKFAFAVVNNEKDAIFFPNNPDSLAMQALWEYMRSETVFQHIRRVVSDPKKVNRYILAEGGNLVLDGRVFGPTVKGLLAALGEKTTVVSQDPYTIKEA